MTEEVDLFWEYSLQDLREKELTIKLPLEATHLDIKIKEGKLVLRTTARVDL